MPLSSVLIEFILRFAVNASSSWEIPFLLAEVLITLGIIGIVAAMTIPTLIANTNSQKYRSQLKKQYQH